MTKLMGILNLTPDSFYDGGMYFNLAKALERAKELEEIGVDIIDIGGESTRPPSYYGESAKPISTEEEIGRVISVIEALKNCITTPISIDTYKPEVARLALLKGASIINDVTGLRDDNMKKVAKDFGCPVIVMHMYGNPKERVENPLYPNGVVQEIKSFFKTRCKELLDYGIEKKKYYLRSRNRLWKNYRTRS